MAHPLLVADRRTMEQDGSKPGLRFPTVEDHEALVGAEVVGRFLMTRPMEEWLALIAAFEPRFRLRGADA
ncbi:MAG: hypothetical protein RLO51_10825 [Thalassobaculum sp.]|uniref:hypothetical protein n=1 Tax=Thalassobaculum sp. TaxID=2022740 RepID=UPI0032EDF2FF